MVEEKIVVIIERKMLEAVLHNAKRLYPRELVLLLRGKKQHNKVMIKEAIIPPLATYGEGFASIPLSILPMDFSIVGTLHSHPSGSLNPSLEDLNNFWGSILIICGFPFTDETCVAAYNHNGERLSIKLIE
ncbi:MAG: Mov34/MPN/PAD-1 family protein [Candidatus Bathyarchaeia archaeon]